MLEMSCHNIANTQIPLKYYSSWPFSMLVYSTLIQQGSPHDRAHTLTCTCTYVYATRVYMSYNCVDATISLHALYT